MGSVKICVPLSICDKGYFEGHLLELVLNALDENAFTSVVKSCPKEDVARFCKYLNEDETDYVLGSYTQEEQDELKEFMMYMGPVSIEEYSEAVGRLLPCAVMAIKKETIEILSDSSVRGLLGQLDPKVPESEIVYREWVAEQANGFIMDFMETSNIKDDVVWHTSVDDKEKLYSSGCVAEEPGCSSEVIPDFGYKNIKVALKNDQKGYLGLKLLSFMIRLMDDELILQKVLVESEEDLGCIYPLLDDQTKLVLERNVSRKIAAQFEEKGNSEDEDEIFSAASTILGRIESNAILEKDDISPFGTIILCLNSIYDDSKADVLFENSLKSMTDAVKAYLHIF